MKGIKEVKIKATKEFNEEIEGLPYRDIEEIGYNIIDDIIDNVEVELQDDVKECLEKILESIIGC